MVSLAKSFSFSTALQEQVEVIVGNDENKVGNFRATKTSFAD